MTISIICSELLILGGDQLSLTVYVHKAVVKVKVTVKVLNFSECLPGQYLPHEPEYHSEISFCDVQG